MTDNNVYRQITMTKGDDKYIFRYQIGNEKELLDEILRQAKSPNYDLDWFESIGSAKIVKDYFIVRINNDHSVGRCGFVYEEGSEKYDGFLGNHIHLPADIRVINSPEYEKWFWICI